VGIRARVDLDQVRVQKAHLDDSVGAIPVSQRDHLGRRHLNEPADFIPHLRKEDVEPLGGHHTDLETQLNLGSQAHLAMLNDPRNIRGKG